MRRRLGTLLLVLGILALLSPAFQRVQAFYYQAALRQENTQQVEKNEEAGEETGEEPALERESAVLSPPAEGKPLSLFLQIPRLGVEAVVVEGTIRSQLKKGPGLYEESPFPWEKGANVAIAGHRTTYGAWFRHVDELEKGDKIKLVAGDTTYYYRVESVFPVAKNNWSVIEPAGYEALTLTTCHPPGSAKERLIVRARLVSVFHPHWGR